MGAGTEAITVSSEGAFKKPPDSIRCDLAISGGSTKVTWERIVVIGGDAWIDIGSEWTPTNPTDEGLVNDLTQYCPGSSLFWEGFLPRDLAGIQGQIASRIGRS